MLLCGKISNKKLSDKTTKLFDMIWTALIIFFIAIIVGYGIYRTNFHYKFITILSLSVICLCVIVYFLKGYIEYSDQPYVALKQKEQHLKSLQPQELIAQFEERLKEKDSVQARLVLANTLMSLGKVQQAEQHYQKAYNLDKGKTPNVILAYSEYLIVKNKFKISQQAFSLINQALEIEKNNIKALFFKGGYYAQDKKTDDAVKFWQQMADNLQDIPYHAMFKKRLISAMEFYEINQVKINN